MSGESERAQAYQNLITRYEAVGQKIQALIDENGGHTENLAPEEMQKYRALAAERDDLYSQLKALESSWLDSP